MTGQSPATALYLNDGNGDFTEVIDITIPDRIFDTITEFEDFDGDGDLDLYIYGSNDGGGIGIFTRIYLNDGTGNFTQLSNPLLPQFQGTGAAIANIDDDGHLDILISAQDNNSQFVADTYLNDGNANFTPSGSTVFIPVTFAAVAFIDVENDGDADVIISGVQENSKKLTRLYLNDGLESYNMDMNTDFENLQADDIDVADTDNDGDLDILISGLGTNFAPQTILYLNNGIGQFTELTDNNFIQTFAGANAIADLDIDGDQDIVICGSQAVGLPNIINIVYENLGNNEFEPVKQLGGEYIAECIIDDFNGDDFSDIIIQGFVDDTNFYWNNSEVLSISEMQDNFTMHQVYPNTSNDIINISSEDKQLLKIELYNMTDNLILKTDLNSNIYSLNISNYPSGTYLLRVFIQNHNSINTKFVKM